MKFNRMKQLRVPWKPQCELIVCSSCSFCGSMSMMRSRVHTRFVHGCIVIASFIVASPENQKKKNSKQLRLHIHYRSSRSFSDAVYLIPSKIHSADITLITLRHNKMAVFLSVLISCSVHQVPFAEDPLRYESRSHIPYLHTAS